MGDADVGLQARQHHSLAAGVADGGAGQRIVRQAEHLLADRRVPGEPGIEGPPGLGRLDGGDHRDRAELRAHGQERDAPHDVLAVFDPGQESRLDVDHGEHAVVRVDQMSHPPDPTPVGCGTPDDTRRQTASVSEKRPSQAGLDNRLAGGFFCGMEPIRNHATAARPGVEALLEACPHLNCRHRRLRLRVRRRLEVPDYRCEIRLKARGNDRRREQHDQRLQRMLDHPPPPMRRDREDRDGLREDDQPYTRVST